MDEIFAALGSPEPCVLVMVTRTLRSSPRAVGSAMVVRRDGSVVGNISEGCVDGDAVLTAEDVLATGRPVLTTYGVSDGDAMAVGLACGGEIDVVVSPGPPAAVVDLLREHEQREIACALLTVVSPEDLRGRHLAIGPDDVRGTTGDPARDRALAAEARVLLGDGRSGVVVTRPDGAPEVTAVVRVVAPAPRMLIFGSGAFAPPLAALGKILGYHVTVCDARPTFATRARVPAADEVVVEWPHRYLESTPVDARTVICSLSHDAKFEIPLLVAALRRPAAYVGALGSRRTQAVRTEALRRAGLTDAELTRLRAPIGLDIGARSPGETAVSIAAEIVSAQTGRTGRALRETIGSIHPVGTQ